MAPNVIAWAAGIAVVAASTIAVIQWQRAEALESSLSACTKESDRREVQITEQNDKLAAAESAASAAQFEARRLRAEATAANAQSAGQIANLQARLRKPGPRATCEKAVEDLRAGWKKEAKP